MLDLSSIIEDWKEVENDHFLPYVEVKNFLQDIKGYVP